MAAKMDTVRKIPGSLPSQYEDKVPGGRLPSAPSETTAGDCWPRIEDDALAVDDITASTSPIPTDPGRIMDFGPPGVRGAVLVTGDFSGLEISRNAKNWRKLQNPDVLPPRFYIRRTSTAAGEVLMRYWRLREGEGLEDLAALAEVAGGTHGGGGSKEFTRSSCSQQGLAADAAGEQVTIPSGTKRVRVIADQNNATGVFLGITQAQAAGLGGANGGCPVFAGGEVDWFGATLWIASAGGVETAYFIFDS